MKSLFSFYHFIYEQQVSIADKSRNNGNLDNSLCYALWTQILQEQQELQLSSDIERNLTWRAEQVLLQHVTLLYPISEKLY